KLPHYSALRRQSKPHKRRRTSRYRSKIKYAKSQPLLVKRSRPKPAKDLPGLEYFGLMIGHRITHMSGERWKRWELGLLSAHLLMTHLRRSVLRSSMQSSQIWGVRPTPGQDIHCLTNCGQ